MTGFGTKWLLVNKVKLILGLYFGRLLFSSRMGFVYAQA